MMAGKFPRSVVSRSVARSSFLTVLGMFLYSVLLFPGAASAADVVEGKMNGLQCAQEGIVCPVEDIDAVVQLESDFVVMQPDGTFYSIPNLDRAVKARYMLDNVRVTGKIHDRYKSIVAEKLEVEDGSNWRTTWSPDVQKRVYWDLRLPGSSRP